MRIHGNVDRSVAIAISRIKKLLVKHWGQRYNDTGQVISYCVSCTVQMLNDSMKKEAESVKVQMGKELSTLVQDEDVSGSRPDSGSEDRDPTSDSEEGANGSEDSGGE